MTPTGPGARRGGGDPHGVGAGDPAGVRPGAGPARRGDGRARIIPAIPVQTAIARQATARQPPGAPQVQADVRDSAHRPPETATTARMPAITVPTAQTTATTVRRQAQAAVPVSVQATRQGRPTTRPHGPRRARRTPITPIRVHRLLTEAAQVRTAHRHTAADPEALSVAAQWAEDARAAEDADVTDRYCIYRPPAKHSGSAACLNYIKITSHTSDYL